MLNKLIISTFLLLTINVSANSQIDEFHLFNAAKINKDTAISRFEVSIEDWLNFIVENGYDNSLFPDTTKISSPTRIVFDDLKKQNNFLYLKVKKKKDNWLNQRRIFPRKQGFKQLAKTDTNYFSLNIPITGITFEQATRFCNWKNKLYSRRPGRKFKFALPTISIFRQAIDNIDSTNQNKCSMYNSRSCNCIKQQLQYDTKSQGKCLLSVYGYWPNNLGLYNIQGNAAEMTNINGTAMGGSFRHYAFETYSDKYQSYDSAEDWLGFRYIIYFEK